MNKNRFIGELARLETSTILSLIGYENGFNEVADYSIAFRIDYDTVLRDSIDTLVGYSPSTSEESLAKGQLISSFEKSLHRMEETPIEDVDDAYTRFFDEGGEYIKGVKMHTESGMLHLYGLVVHKRIILPGVYPNDTRKPFTVVKDHLRHMCPVGRFRQFKISPDKVESIVVNNLCLTPPLD